MLSSLHIENIAVAKQLDIDFEHGFHVMTGETGAGKSVIIDALRLLLGGRFEKELLRSGEKRAMVQAAFTDLPRETWLHLQEEDIYPDESEVLLLQRIFTEDGKSTAKINGRAVTLTTLRAIAESLIHIHGQNDTQMLFHEAYHMSILDHYVGNQEILEEYKAVYEEWTETVKAKEAFSAEESARAENAKMLQFHIQEIESAKLKNGEEEALFEKRLQLKNAEKISKQLSFTYRALKGGDKANALYILERCLSSLESVSELVPKTKAACETLEHCMEELTEVAENVYDWNTFAEVDPVKQLDALEERLDLISKLKKKYGATVPEIFDYLQKAKMTLARFENADETLLAYTKKELALRTQLTALAGAIHDARHAVASELSAKVQEILAFLDMPKATFHVRVSYLKNENGAYILKANGADQVSFCASTNPGEPEMPIAKIASGGELARIILAIKSIVADKDWTQTLIFDEIDTGVSGKTARKIGIRLLMASRHTQIICVSHSAQIASLADMHMKIGKKEQNGRIHSFVEILNEEARIEELARILGGIEIKEVQKAAAAELLKEKAQYVEAL